MTVWSFYAMVERFSCEQEEEGVVEIVERDISGKTVLKPRAVQ